MAKVSLESISHQYGNVQAIADISFEIPDGEFWVMVGPSGCGKSTILRTIAGLEKATSGNLYFGDRLVNEIPARQRNVAMVFQNYALYPHMSVAENIAFGLKMRQESKSQINLRVQEVALALNLEHLLNRKPKQLSGGQQQRVALGRAIARKPQVFLLDEPLSNLDTQLRDSTRAELKQLHQKVGITTIYVTHDQVEAMTLGDRIVVLKDGAIQQIGRPQEIYESPANAMVASFVGSPPMNLLSATYRNNSFAINDQSLEVNKQIQQCLQPRPEEHFELGIRPEHLQIAHSIAGELSSQAENILIAEVMVIEPLGKEILLRTRLPNSHHSVNLFAPPNWQGKIGEIIKVAIDINRLFIFDAQSGKTLRSAN